MACYAPLKGYKAASGVSFSPKNGGTPLLLPCGQCIGCRLERSRQWAVRCMHEASFHESNQFLTLTYDDEHLPSDQGLVVSDLQKFFKRARKFFKFRYFACGEYGDHGARPHYHVLVFGAVFDDAALARLWPFGFAYSGDLTFDSAAYVARYCTKKVLPNSESWHTFLDTYERCDLITGEIRLVQPEFMLCSRNPGIGRVWVDKFLEDSYYFERDSIIVRGHPCKPPRYYDKVLRRSKFYLFEYRKQSRVRAARLYTVPGSLSPDRLEASRVVRVARLTLKRGKL